MAGGVFAVDILVTAVVVLYITHQYGNIRKYPWVCLLTFLTWFICFSIIFVLPMDVSSVCSCVCISVCISLFVCLGPSTSGHMQFDQSTNHPSIHSTIQTSIHTHIHTQAFYWNCVRDWYCSTHVNVTECEPGNILTDVAVINECVASSACHCAQPLSYLPPGTLNDFWLICNLSSLLLTWCVCVRVCVCV
jgi:hypothetical protein